MGKPFDIQITSDGDAVCIRFRIPGAPASAAVPMARELLFGVLDALDTHYGAPEDEPTEVIELAGAHVLECPEHGVRYLSTQTCPLCTPAGPGGGN